MSNSIAGVKKGNTIDMYFDMFGLTSVEKVKVRSYKNNIVEIENTWHSDLSGKEEYGRFDAKTGKCLNDNSWGGAKRRIKPIKNS